MKYNSHHTFVRIRNIVITLSLLLLVTVPNADAKGKPVTDFSGFWILTHLSIVELPERDNNPQFTDQAKENIADYNDNYSKIIDDPAKVCFLKGMPWTMLNRARDYPMEIYQTKDRIFTLIELYDTYRNIRINGSEVPDSFPPSGNGYSTAKWDGDSLVITTKGLTEIYEVSPIQRSENAVITERWTLRNDPEYGEVLDVEMTIDDPAVYQKPAKAKNILRRAPKGTLVGGYNCSEDLWYNHIEKRQESMQQ